MKTGYLITARLKSTRLKRKILLDIDEETVLDKVIKRCLATKGVDNVILCTSTNAEDEALVEYADKHNIGFFKGSEDDVLKRLLDSARKYKIDRFLSITADNPLHSIKAAESLIAFDNQNNFDFIFTKNLPIGISPYFLRTDALDVAVHMKENTDTEIWGPFINRPDFFKIGNLVFSNIHMPNSLRITCDYDKDYTFILELYKNFQTPMPDISDIIDLFETNHDIFKINAGIVQRMPDKQTMKQINTSFDLNIEAGIRFANKKQIKISPCLIKKLMKL
jgi:spore coat polysaccharide biosynthesis protein SpsF